MLNNPFALLLVAYFSANTYALILGFLNGGFNIFGNFYPINFEYFIIAYTIQLIGLAVFYFAYVAASITYSNKKNLDDSYGYFLIAISFIFLVFSQYTGAHRAGSGFSFPDGSIEKYINFLFVILQPDLLFLIIAPFIKSARLFLIAATIFTASLLLRGWMGAVLLLICVVLIRYYPLRITLRNLFTSIAVLMVIILLLPFLDAIKWSMRVGATLGDLYAIFVDIDYFAVFGVVIESVVARFQNLNIVAYVAANSDYFLSALLNNDFLWFYHAGILSSAYCRISSCAPDVGVYLAESITGYSALTWNVDVGISGWLLILDMYFPVFILYCLVLLAIGYIVFGRLFGIRGVLLFSTLSLIYLFHGWIGSIVNVVIYGSVFYFILRTFHKNPRISNLTPKPPALQVQNISM